MELDRLVGDANLTEPEDVCEALLPPYTLTRGGDADRLLKKVVDLAEKLDDE